MYKHTFILALIASLKLETWGQDARMTFFHAFRNISALVAGVMVRACCMTWWHRYAAAVCSGAVVLTGPIQWQSESQGRSNGARPLHGAGRVFESCSDRFLRLDLFGTNQVCLEILWKDINLFWTFLSIVVVSRTKALWLLFILTFLHVLLLFKASWVFWSFVPVRPGGQKRREWFHRSQRARRGSRNLSSGRRAEMDRLQLGRERVS